MSSATRAVRWRRGGRFGIGSDARWQDVRPPQYPLTYRPKSLHDDRQTLMKIGILADIHGHIENLRNAINRLNRSQVDQFVLLGDVIYDRTKATETVALLKDCGAVGVWGNHKLGLCVDPDDQIRDMYTESVLEFFSTLHSRFELGDLLFSHTLPIEDPNDPVAYFLGKHLFEDRFLKNNFSEFPHRVMMIGHFHRWFAATPTGSIVWDGSEPLELNFESRYLIAVHAVMYGWAAVFDDGRNVLMPIRL